MRQHYALGRIFDYQTEPLDETTRVVNAQWRQLDSQVRAKVGQLNRTAAAFATLQLDGDIEPPRAQRFERQKAQLKERIDELQAEVSTLKQHRKAVPHHVTIAELPEDQRFHKLNTKTKDFIDTVKMIAYRAETAMVETLRERMSHHDDARALLREVFTTEADIIPDEAAGTLTIRLHHTANRSSDEAIRHLITELNATMTVFPRSELRLVYELVSTKIPEVSRSDVTKPSSGPIGGHERLRT